MYNQNLQTHISNLNHDSQCQFLHKPFQFFHLDNNPVEIYNKYDKKKERKNKKKSVEWVRQMALVLIVWMFFTQISVDDNHNVECDDKNTKLVK